MEKIEIGVISKAFGVKGEIKVMYSTDFPKERFKKGTYLYLEDETQLLIKESRAYGDKFYILKLEGIETPEEADKYQHLTIYKAKEDIHDLKKGEYYFSDLKDLDVYCNQEKVGKVIKVEEGIKYNYLRVKTGEKEVLIPFIEVFIKEVDLNNKKIEINFLEGLI